MASRGVNKVIIVGNLGQDPEVRFMPNGNAVANFTVATSENWKDKQTGENKEKTEWHRIVIYQRLAEIAGEYLKKGSKIYIEGRLQTRKWQNQQGIEQYTTEIVANEMQMLDSRQGASSGGFQASAPQQAPQHNQGGYQQKSAPQAAPQQSSYDAPNNYSAHQQAPQNNRSGYQQKAAPQQPQGGFKQQAPQQAPKVNPQEPTIDFDDDIPF